MNAHAAASVDKTCLVDSIETPVTIDSLSTLKSNYVSIYNQSSIKP